MELVGTLQIMKGDDDEIYESRVFRVITHASDDDPDIRLEVDHGGKTIMFRFDPGWLMAAMAKSLLAQEE